MKLAIVFVEAEVNGRPFAVHMAWECFEFDIDSIGGLLNLSHLNREWHVGSFAAHSY